VRFTSIDPLWELQYSWSPYNYSENNPINKSDPTGLNPGILAIPIIEKIVEGIVVAATVVGLANSSDELDYESKETQTKIPNNYSLNPSKFSAEANTAMAQDATKTVPKPQKIDNSGNSQNPPPPDLNNWNDEKKNINKEKMKQGDNTKKNKEFDAVVKKLNLDKSQRRLLHDEITGQNMKYKEILETAKTLFK